MTHHHFEVKLRKAVQDCKTKGKLSNKRIQTIVSGVFKKHTQELKDRGE